MENINKIHILLLGCRYDNEKTIKAFSTKEDAEAAFYMMPLESDDKFQYDQYNSEVTFATINTLENFKKWFELD